MTTVVAMLCVQERDGRINNVPLKDGETLRIGRMEGSDLRLDDPSVSRSHAMVTASPSGVVVCDLASTNGVYVNGNRISIPVDLQPSDVVDIGTFKLSVTVHNSEAVESSNVRGRTMTAQLRPMSAVVLVGRLRGFKELRSLLDTEPVEKMWACWRKICAAAVDSNGGKIDKVLDDCIVAVWYGADIATVSSGAVRAAQQIDVHTRQYSVCGDWPFHETYPLICSLAMTSGFALIGSVGGKSGTRDFAVLGDTINTAFKVAEITESLAQSVFISQEIAQQLESSLRMKQVGAVEDSKTGDRTSVFAVQL